MQISLLKWKRKIVYIQLKTLNKNHNFMLALIIFQKGVEHRKFDKARTPDLQYHLSAFRGTRISASQTWQYRISGSFSPSHTPTLTPIPRHLRLNGVYRCGEGEDGVRFKKSTVWRVSRFVTYRDDTYTYHPF